MDATNATKKGRRTMIEQYMCFMNEVNEQHFYKMTGTFWFKID